MSFSAILHGRVGGDVETDYAQKLLTDAEIPYRLELDRSSQEEDIELVYFGRYSGLSRIHQAFGKGHLEIELQSFVASKQLVAS